MKNLQTSLQIENRLTRACQTLLNSTGLPRNRFLPTKVVKKIQIRKKLSLNSLSKAQEVWWLSLDDKIVILRKNYRIDGRNKAVKNWILTAYDPHAGDATSAISSINQGIAAPTPTSGKRKGTTNSSDVQAKSKKAQYSLQGAFYSNVHHAVEDIKQDKATPQQWIAML